MPLPHRFDSETYLPVPRRSIPLLCWYFALPTCRLKKALGISGVTLDKACESGCPPTQSKAQTYNLMQVKPFCKIPYGHVELNNTSVEVDQLLEAGAFLLELLSQRPPRFATSLQQQWGR